MMKNKPLRALLVSLLIFAAAAPNLAQAGRKKVVFAVLNDGRTLEPIVLLERGKIVDPAPGETNGWKDFAALYYKPKTAYSLIFGGAPSGKATVVKAAPGSDCAPNMAEATSASPKAKLGGFVMALATDLPAKKGLAGLRRMPTAAERAEIERLVREELARQKVSAANLKGLRYHNLTALDVDGDKKPEFVGSYWLPTTKTERAIFFFIAEKSGDGYALAHSSFELVKQEDVMSGDIKDVDKGILNELLLDALDIDGDGAAEIFTIGQAFEGNNFRIYKRAAGKWTQIKEIYNYHCGY